MKSKVSEFAVTPWAFVAFIVVAMAGVMAGLGRANDRVKALDARVKALEMRR